MYLHMSSGHTIAYDVDLCRKWEFREIFFVVLMTFDVLARSPGEDLGCVRYCRDYISMVGIVTCRNLIADAFNGTNGTGAVGQYVDRTLNSDLMECDVFVQK